MLIRGSIIIFIIGLIISFTVFSVQESSISVDSLLESSFAKASLSGQRQGRVLGIKELNDTIKKAGEQIASISRPIAQKVYSQIGKLPISEEAPPEPDPVVKLDYQYKVNTKSAAVLDTVNDIFIFKENSDVVLPIASLTKLMTALIFLDYNPGWEVTYKVKESDRREGGKIYLFWGEEVRVKDLFYLSLVASANSATAALVSSTGLSEAEFVAKMNEQARELGLNYTQFADPTGLSDNNVSTAQEVAYLVKSALSHKDIRQATLAKEYRFKTSQGKTKIVQTTDDLLKNFPQNGIKIIGGKTGRTIAAGYCFAGLFIDKDGHEVVSVILGSQSNGDRFSETKDLVEWVYGAYNWVEH